MGSKMHINLLNEEHRSSPLPKPPKVLSQRQSNVNTMQTGGLGMDLACGPGACNYKRTHGNRVLQRRRRVRVLLHNAALQGAI